MQKITVPIATKTTKENKKTAMLKALKITLGVVSHACEQAGIDRTTHYRWMKSDPHYKQAVDDVAEATIDFVECELFKQIKNGNTTATIFFLKTKARQRGYIERQEIEHSGTGLTITFDSKTEKGINYLTGEANSQTERNTNSTGG